MTFHENKNIKIYNGDAIETIENNIKENEIDIVVTSPPYNLGKKYSSYNDKIPFNNYINWMNDFGKIIHKVLKSDGSFFLNIGYQNLQPSTPFILVQKLTEYFKLQNTIIWTKSITVSNESYGHFIPNNSNRYLQTKCDRSKIRKTFCECYQIFHLALGNHCHPFCLCGYFI